jgi:hypothetical protein
MFDLVIMLWRPWLNLSEGLPIDYRHYLNLQYWNRAKRHNPKILSDIKKPPKL